MEVTLPYQIVLVCRSENEKTPVIILPHEVEVLRAVHGDDAIRETDAELPDGVTTATFDTADEYARLQQYYRGSEKVPDPVGSALGKLKEFESSFEQISGDDDEKLALIEQAKSLGIKATKTWGVEKLQSAIDEALAG